MLIKCANRKIVRYRVVQNCKLQNQTNKLLPKHVYTFTIRTFHRQVQSVTVVTWLQRIVQNRFRVRWIAHHYYSGCVAVACKLIAHHRASLQS